MSRTTSQMTVGDLVKYSRPFDAREAKARFVIVEPRGDRVLIRLLCDLPIPPTEVVPVGEIAPAD